MEHAIEDVNKDVTYLINEDELFNLKEENEHACCDN